MHCFHIYATSMRASLLQAALTLDKRHLSWTCKLPCLLLEELELEFDGFLAEFLTDVLGICMHKCELPNARLNSALVHDIADPKWRLDSNTAKVSGRLHCTIWGEGLRRHHYSGECTAERNYIGRG